MTTQTSFDVVQHWINTSSNSFAVSLRQQQTRGRTLTANQIAAAAKAAQQSDSPASQSRHFGAVGDQYVIRFASASRFTSKSGREVTKFIVNADDELVYFGHFDFENHAVISFTVAEFNEFRGHKSTVIRNVTAADLDVSEAASLLQAFRVQTPESKTPFADFAKRLNGGV